MNSLILACHLINLSDMLGDIRKTSTMSSLDNQCFWKKNWWIFSIKQRFPWWENSEESQKVINEVVVNLFKLLNKIYGRLSHGRAWLFAKNKTEKKFFVFSSAFLPYFLKRICAMQWNSQRFAYRKKNTKS